MIDDKNVNERKRGNCEDCFWYEQCGCESICEYYYSLREGNEYTRWVEEYYQDLKMRAKEYWLVIKELDD